MGILWLAQPAAQPLKALQRINDMECLQRKLEYHATEICALALSSDSAPVWVNAFGPIAFCKTRTPLSQAMLINTLYRLPLASRYPETRGDGRRVGKVGEADRVAGIHHSRCSFSAKHDTLDLLINHLCILWIICGTVVKELDQKPWYLYTQGQYGFHLILLV